MHRSPRWLYRLAALAGVPLAVVTLTASQFPRLPKLGLPSGAPRGVEDAAFERLLRRDPPISTALPDAVTEAVPLDGYEPLTSIPLPSLGYDREGIYHLFGGDFTLMAQSYCLRAGADAPASGDGYAYAELRGPESASIRHVLQRSSMARHIPQATVQMLLWAMLSRTRVRDMSAELRRAAERLLDKQELASLDGAVGFIPDEVRARVMPRLPAPVQRFLEAENRIRALATGTGTTFDEWRAVAVPAGKSGPQPGDRVVPSGRWSYVPAGFFLRFVPSSFLETRLDVSVPRAIRITRDARGRIAAIADRLRELTVTFDGDNATIIYRNGDLAADAAAVQRATNEAMKKLPLPGSC
jgi:hypothetical protein